MAKIKKFLKVHFAKKKTETNVAVYSIATEANHAKMWPVAVMPVQSSFQNLGWDNSSVLLDGQRRSNAD